MRLCLQQTASAAAEKTASHFQHVSLSNSDFDSGTLPRVQPNSEFKTEITPTKPQTLGTFWSAFFLGGRHLIDD